MVTPTLMKKNITISVVYTYSPLYANFSVCMGHPDDLLHLTYIMYPTMHALTMTFHFHVINEPEAISAMIFIMSFYLLFKEATKSLGQFHK